MARKRMLDPDFFMDAEIGRWSFMARLFYQGLWVVSDDEGIFDAEPIKLKAQIFPYDKIITPRIIKQLKDRVRGNNENRPKVGYYEEKGKEYGYLFNFSKHQKVQHPTPSKYPKPPDGFSRTFTNFHETSPQSDQSNQSKSKEVRLGQSSQNPDFSTKGFKNEEIQHLGKTITKHLRHPEGSDAHAVCLKEVVTGAVENRAKNPMAYAITSIMNRASGK